MHRLRGWLASVPGRDGLERRQVYLLQIVLFVVATVFLVAMTGNALTNLPKGSSNGVVANLIAALIALGLIAVLRRGQFRLDAATQARIFDPFFTTKTQGRGLGLAAVLGIVRAHHGALKAYSEPGHGSTFELLLPLTTADVAPDPWANRSTTPWRGEGTVLVVDDEPMVRDVAQAILQRLGLTVVAASDGEEAVLLFTADPDRFAVVLLDLTMPRLSGAETFRQIRAFRPDAQVVLMSGYSEEEAGGRFSGKGLAGFLEKPFSTQGLGAAIERVLGTRGPGDEPRSPSPPVQPAD